MLDSNEWGAAGIVDEGFGRSKKCGVGSRDSRLRSQPRLPGSVVGEASMGQDLASGKIT